MCAKSVFERYGSVQSKVGAWRPGRQQGREPHEAPDGLGDQNNNQSRARQKVWVISPATAGGRLIPTQHFHNGRMPSVISRSDTWDRTTHL